MDREILVAEENSGLVWYPDGTKVVRPKNNETDDNEDLSRRWDLCLEESAINDSESPSIFQQFVGYLFSLPVTRDIDPLSKLRRKVVAPPSEGVCVVLHSESPFGASVCFLPQQQNTNLHWTKHDLTDIPFPVNLATFSKCGTLLVLSSSLVAVPAIIYHLDVENCTISSAVHEVETEPSMGAIVGLHFRRDTELVIVHRAGFIRRITLSRDITAKPACPSYHTSSSRLCFNMEKVGVVNATTLLLSENNNADGFTDTDVLYLLSDWELFLVGLHENLPYYHTSLCCLAWCPPNAPSPPSVASMFRQRGHSALLRFADRPKELCLSPSGTYIASITHSGKLVVRYSGIRRNTTVDLGTSVVMFSDVGIDINSITWWSNDMLLIGKKSGGVGLLSVETDNIGREITSVQGEISLDVDEEIHGPVEVFAVSKRSFILDCYKSWKPSTPDDTSTVEFSYENHTLHRQYTLKTLKQASSIELMRHLQHKHNYSKAIAIGEKYQLNLDDIYKSKWKEEGGDLSILKKINDWEWVAKECMLLHYIPTTAQRTRELVEYGLSISLDSEKTSSASIKRRYFHDKLRVLEKKLDIYTSRCGDDFRAVEFTMFRSGDIVNKCKELAENGDVEFLSLLVHEFPLDCLPDMLSILELLPETLSPLEYSHLLPCVVGSSSANSASTESYFVLSGEGGVKPCVDPSKTYFYWKEEGQDPPEYPGIYAIVKWYYDRILEIDTCSGMLSIAVELAQLAWERVPQSEERLALLVSDAKYLSRLVYRCNLSDRILLRDWHKSDDYEKLCVMCEDAIPSNVVSVLQARLLPLYREKEEVKLKWLKILRDYMLMRVSESDEQGILLCLAIVYNSRPLVESDGGVPIDQRLIPYPQSLMETVLACSYGSSVINETTLKAMDEMFECLPVRNLALEDKYPALKHLQTRVETLDGHLFVNNELQKLGLSVPLSFFVECCKEHDDRRVEKVLNTDELSLGGEASSSDDDGDLSLNFLLVKPKKKALSKKQKKSSRFGSPDAETDRGRALVLGIFKKGVDTLHTREEWEDLIQIVWSVRERALPYISPQFCFKRSLVTLLRAKQFDLSHELIVTLLETDNLAKAKIENIVLSVAREFFNSAAAASSFNSYSDSDPLYLSKQALNTLPYTTELKTAELHLIEAIDLLSNELMPKPRNVKEEEDRTIIPLQIRQKLSSTDVAVEFIREIVVNNPDIYNVNVSPSAVTFYDAKLLRFANLIGLSSVDQVALVRLIIVECALKNDQPLIAMSITKSMIEKNDILMEQKDPDEDVIAARETTARACMLVARNVQDGVLWARKALVRCSPSEMSDILDFIQQEPADNVALDWKSVFSKDGIEAFRRDGTLPEWAIAELVWNRDAGMFGLVHFLDGAGAFEEKEQAIERHLNSLLNVVSEYGASDQYEQSVLSMIICSFGIHLLGNGFVRESPAKGASKLSKDEAIQESGFLHGVIERSSQGESLVSIFSGNKVNADRFSKDVDYRRDMLQQAAFDIGRDLQTVPSPVEEEETFTENQSWNSLLQLVEGDENLDVWSLYASYVRGAISTSSDSMTESELDNFLKKSVAVKYLAKSDIVGSLLLLGDTVWNSLPGRNYKRLLMVEKLIYACLGQVLNNSCEDEIKKTLVEQGREEIKSRRMCYNKLRTVKLDKKLDVKKWLLPPVVLVCKAIRPIFPNDERLDIGDKFVAAVHESNDSIIGEMLPLMTVKNVAVLAKLMENFCSTTRDKPRSSFVILQFIKDRMGFNQQQNSDESESPPFYTKVPNSVGRLGRQRFNSLSKLLLNRLEKDDVVSLVRLVAYRGGREQLLDLELRKKILQDVEEKFESSDDEFFKAKRFIDAIAYLFSMTDALSRDDGLSPADVPKREQLVKLLNLLELSGGENLEELTLSNVLQSKTLDYTETIQFCNTLSVDWIFLYGKLLDGYLASKDRSQIGEVVFDISHELLKEDGWKECRLLGEELLNKLRRAITEDGLDAQTKVHILQQLRMAGFDNEQDGQLEEGYRSLEFIEKHWPDCCCGLQDVSSVAGKMEVFGNKLTGKAKHKRMLLMLWEGEPEARARNDLFAQAENCCVDVIGKFLQGSVTQGPPSLSSKGTSVFHKEWFDLYNEVLLQQSDDRDSDFVGLRLLGNGLTLLAEEEELELFSTLVAVQDNVETSLEFGLFSTFPSVRERCSKYLKTTKLPLTLTMPTLHLVMGTLGPTEIWENDSVAYEFFKDHTQPVPFTLSRWFYCLCLVSKGDFINAGLVALDLHQIGTVFLRGLWWYGILMKTIQTAANFGVRESGGHTSWRFCSDLVAAASKQLQEGCVVADYDDDGWSQKWGEDESSAGVGKLDAPGHWRDDREPTSDQNIGSDAKIEAQEGWSDDGELEIEQEGAIVAAHDQAAADTAAETQEGWSDDGELEIEQETSENAQADVVESVAVGKTMEAQEGWSDDDELEIEQEGAIAAVHDQVAVEAAVETEETQDVNTAVETQEVDNAVGTQEGWSDDGELAIEQETSEKVQAEVVESVALEKAVETQEGWSDDDELEIDQEGTIAAVHDQFAVNTAVETEKTQEVNTAGETQEVDKALGTQEGWSDDGELVIGQETSEKVQADVVESVPVGKTMEAQEGWSDDDGLEIEQEGASATVHDQVAADKTEETQEVDTAVETEEGWSDDNELEIEQESTSAVVHDHAVVDTAVEPQEGWSDDGELAIEQETSEKVQAEVVESVAVEKAVETQEGWSDDDELEIDQEGTIAAVHDQFAVNTAVETQEVDNALGTQEGWSDDGELVIGQETSEKVQADVVESVPVGKTMETEEGWSDDDGPEIEQEGASATVHDQVAADKTEETQEVDTAVETEEGWSDDNEREIEQESTSAVVHDHAVVDTAVETQEGWSDNGELAIEQETSEKVQAEVVESVAVEKAVETQEGWSDDDELEIEQEGASTTVHDQVAVDKTVETEEGWSDNGELAIEQETSEKVQAEVVESVAVEKAVETQEGWSDDDELEIEQEGASTTVHDQVAVDKTVETEEGWSDNDELEIEQEMSENAQAEVVESVAVEKAVETQEGWSDDDGLEIDQEGTIVAAQNQATVDTAETQEGWSDDDGLEIDQEGTIVAAQNQATVDTAETQEGWSDDDGLGSDQEDGSETLHDTRIVDGTHGFNNTQDEQVEIKGGWSDSGEDIGVNETVPEGVAVAASSDRVETQEDWRDDTRNVVHVSATIQEDAFVDDEESDGWRNDVIVVGAESKALPSTVPVAGVARPMESLVSRKNDDLEETSAVPFEKNKVNEHSSDIGLQVGGEDDVAVVNTSHTDIQNASQFVEAQVGWSDDEIDEVVSESNEKAQTQQGWSDGGDIVVEETTNAFVAPSSPIHDTTTPGDVEEVGHSHPKVEDTFTNVKSGDVSEELSQHHHSTGLDGEVPGTPGGSGQTAGLSKHESSGGWSCDLGDEDLVNDEKSGGSGSKPDVMEDKKGGVDGTVQDETSAADSDNRTASVAVEAGTQEGSRDNGTCQEAETSDTAPVSERVIQTHASSGGWSCDIDDDLVEEGLSTKEEGTAVSPPGDQSVEVPTPKTETQDGWSDDGILEEGEEEVSPVEDTTPVSEPVLQTHASSGGWSCDIDDDLVEEGLSTKEEGTAVSPPGDQSVEVPTPKTETQDGWSDDGILEEKEVPHVEDTTPVSEPVLQTHASSGGWSCDLDDDDLTNTVIEGQTTANEQEKPTEPDVILARKASSGGSSCDLGEEELTINTGDKGIKSCDTQQTSLSKHQSSGGWSGGDDLEFDEPEPVAPLKDSSSPPVEGGDNNATGWSDDDLDI